MEHGVEDEVLASLGFKERKNSPHPHACIQQSPQEEEPLCLATAILAQKDNFLSSRHTITTYSIYKNNAVFSNL